MKRVRLLSLILALVMLLALTACGSKTPSEAPSAPAENQNTEQPEEVAEPAWPTGDVTFYIPAAAGGGTDIIARMWAQEASKITGTNFVIVNDTTGGGTVAFETIRNADPDGLNLLFYHTGMCSMIGSGKYDHGMDEFRVIDFVTDADKIGSGLFVNPDLGFETFDDFIQYAKEHPGELVGGCEINGADHAYITLLNDQFGIETTPVHAGSNAEKLPLVMGGSIDFIFCPPPGLTDYVKSGDLQVLCFAGSERHPELPDVPTLVDLGYEEINVPVILFMAAPAGLPDEIYEAIHELVVQLHEEGAYAEGIANTGYTFVDEMPAEDVMLEMLYGQEADYIKAFELINSNS